MTRQSGEKSFIKSLKKRKAMAVGLVILIVMLILAVFADVISPFDTDTIDVQYRLNSPNGRNLMGTDEFGRDVFTRVIFGARYSLTVAAGVVLIAVGMGLVFGLIAGYFPKLDSIIMRIMDGLMAFPGVVLAIAMMGAMGPSLLNVIIALGIVYMPRTARIVRSYILSIRETQYIEAAKSIGATSYRVISKHILPNCVSPIIVQASFIFSYAILGEAALSFLGVGVPATLPSWGNILSDGRVFMQIAPWLTVFPGLMIMITVLALNMIGDGLRDHFDPKLVNRG